MTSLYAAGRRMTHLTSLTAFRAVYFGAWHATCTVDVVAAVSCGATKQAIDIQRLRFCSNSTAIGGQETRNKPADTSRKAQINQLLYRAKQRGFLELDLLVGQWAQAQVPHMDAALLHAFTDVLDQENPDLFKWLTGQEGASEEMQQNPAFVALRDHVASQMAKHSVPVAQAAPGKEWVRGWDDWKRPS